MNQESLDLAQIRAAVEQAGSPWETDETSMTALSQEERVIRLGVTPPPGEMSLVELDAALSSKAALVQDESAASVGAPASFDLRNVSGNNYVTPIRDQLQCGSCVAFGTCGAVESAAAYERRDPNVKFDLSEAQLFYCWGRAEGRNCSNGWWPENAFKAIHDNGLTFEDYYPYTAGDQNCTGLNADWPNKCIHIGSYTHLTSPGAMKEWISTIGGIDACFAVYNDFFAYRSGVYRYVSGALAGGHCVTLIGYDDAQGCWIGKNSWGTGWGEAGFFKIAYGQCGIETWLGPWGASGVSTRLWRNNVQVSGLWTNESDRNAWVYLSGVGWRKVAANDDQITLSMLAQLIAAKATARPVNVFDDGGTINQLYVL